MTSQSRLPVRTRVYDWTWWRSYLMVFACGLSPITAEADAAWLWTPGAKVGAEYSDNLFLQNTHAKESESVSASVDLAAQRQTDDMTMLLRPRLRAVRYIDEDQFNREDQLLDMRIDWPREMSQLNLGASYARESSATTELESTGLVATDKRRNTYRLDPGWIMQVSDVASVQASLSYSRVEYDDAQLTGLTDFWDGSGSVNYRLQVNDILAWSVGGYGSKMHAAVIGNKSREYGLQVQAEGELTGEASWSVRVGSRRGVTAYRVFFRELEFIDEGWSLTATLNMPRRWGAMAANASRSSQASGTGYVQLVDRVSSEASYIVSEGLSLSVLALRAHYEEQRAGGRVRDYTRAELAADQLIGENARLRASYSWYTQEVDGVAGQPEANTVSVSVEWHEPMGVRTPALW